MTVGHRDLPELRVQEPRVDAPPPPDPPLSPVPLLLIVVRDLIRRRRLEAEARQRGMRPIVAAVAGEVTAELGDARPEVCIIDCDALELIEQLSLDASVVVLAEDEELADRLELARRGASACLTRGASANEVLAAADLALARRAIPDLTVVALAREAALIDLLRRHGLEVHPVTTPTDVWVGNPGLLLVDADDPEHLDLCRALRTDRRWANVPIVATTASDHPDTVSLALGAGADDCLREPVFGREFVVRVKRHLDRFRDHTARAEADPLTGVANRRTGSAWLGRQLRLGDRLDRPISVAQIAIEDGGDENAIRILGELLQNSFRDEDLVVRWCRSRFVVGLFGAERQAAVDRITLVLREYQQYVSSSVRGAVAQYPVDGGDVETLVEAGDEALAQAPAGQVIGVPEVRTDGPQTTDVAIVEHDDATAAAIADALTDLGWHSRRFSNGASAVMALCGASVSLTARVVVMSDVMPAVSGYEVLALMRREGLLDATTVIMLSESDDAARSRELGAAEHVVKPVDAAGLAEQLGTLLS